MKKCIANANAFLKILDEPCRKLNKIWAGLGGEFYNRSMNSWFHDKDIEMYSTHNEERSIAPESFIKTLGN